MKLTRQCAFSRLPFLKALLFIVVLACSQISFAQVDKVYDYLPPSPTVAELGKYGLIPINMSSGAMSTSIDLYTVHTANLSVPISLSYSSSGVRVDQIASNVGMNWSLNAGGVISRIIRD